MRKATLIPLFAIFVLCLGGCSSAKPNTATPSSVAADTAVQASTRPPAPVAGPAWCKALRDASEGLLPALKNAKDFSQITDAFSATEEAANAMPVITGAQILSDASVFKYQIYGTGPQGAAAYQETYNKLEADETAALALCP